MLLLWSFRTLSCFFLAGLLGQFLAFLFFVSTVTHDKLNESVSNTSFSASSRALVIQYLKQYESGELESQPGCTDLETLEAKMLGKLSKIREIAGACSGKPNLERLFLEEQRLNC